MRSADCGPCCATSEVRRARNWSASRRSCCAPPRKSGRGAEEPLTLHRRRGPRYRVPRSRLPPEEGPGPTPGVDRPRALQTVPRLPPRVRPRCAHRRRWSRVRRPGALQRLRALWALRRSMPVWGYLHADREDAQRLPLSSPLIAGPSDSDPVSANHAHAQVSMRVAARCNATSITAGVAPCIDTWGRRAIVVFQHFRRHAHRPGFLVSPRTLASTFSGKSICELARRVWRRGSRLAKPSSSEESPHPNSAS